MKGNVVVCFAAAALLMSVGCQKKPESSGAKTVEIDGVPTVQNAAEPVNQTCPWRYEEDLVISNEMTAPETSFVYIVGAVADDEGNIYLVDPTQARIQVFDRWGHYLRSIGKKGEGPGELIRPGSMFLDGEGYLVVYDYQLRRVSWFARSGRFVRSVSLDRLGWASEILPWTRHRFVSAIQRRDPSDPELSRYQMAVVDTSGAVVDSLGTFTGRRMKRIRMSDGIIITYFTGYEPRLVWDVAPGPVFYVGYSGEYRIRAYDASGKLIRRFERAWQPVPIPEAKRRKAANSFTRMPEEAKKQIEVPKTEPAFYDIQCDDLGYVWVQRTTETPYRFDVFDPQGHYVCVMDLDCEPLSWSSGYLYARRTAPGTSSLELVRLRRVPLRL